MLNLVALMSPSLNHNIVCTVDSIQQQRAWHQSSISSIKFTVASSYLQCHVLQLFILQYCWSTVNFCRIVVQIASSEYCRLFALSAVLQASAVYFSVLQLSREVNRSTVAKTNEVYCSNRRTQCNLLHAKTLQYFFLRVRITRYPLPAWAKKLRLSKRCQHFNSLFHRRLLEVTHQVTSCFCCVVQCILQMVFADIIYL